MTDPEDMRTPPRTEDSVEHGWTERRRDSPDAKTYKDLGQSEELDPDNTGDVADEGSGHRG